MSSRKAITTAALHWFVIYCCASTNAFGAEAGVPRDTAQPIRERARPVIAYTPSFGGDPSIARLTLSAGTSLSLTRRQLAVGVLANYDRDVVQISRSLSAERLLLHRLELGSTWAWPIGPTTSMSLDAIAVLSGDLARGEASNWQPDVHVSYNSTASHMSSFDVGVEASRLFGPLVPYPTLGFYWGTGTSRLRLQAALPRQFDAFFLLDSWTHLGLIATLDGRYWWATDTDSPHPIVIQEIRTGPRFATRVLSGILLDVRGGLVAIRRTVSETQRIRFSPLVSSCRSVWSCALWSKVDQTLAV